MYHFVHPLFNKSAQIYCMPIAAKHIFVYTNQWLVYVIIHNHWLSVNTLFDYCFIIHMTLLRFYSMQFMPERLIELRKDQGITRAEAARRLNMSAMGYGRYEKGSRTPSYQTVSYIAHKFNTTVDYLYGVSDEKDRYLLPFTPVIILNSFHLYVRYNKQTKTR